MKHEFKNIVAETLLIPLYMRAKESRRELIPEQPLGRMTRLCYKFSSLLGYRIISK